MTAQIEQSRKRSVFCGTRRARGPQSTSVPGTKATGPGAPQKTRVRLCSVWALCDSRCHNPVDDD